MLFFPFPFFLFASWIALFRLSHGKFRLFFGVLLLGITLLSTDLVASRLIGILENRYPWKSASETQPADAIIVLSGMVNPLTGKRSPEFTSGVDRILAGMELLRAQKAKYLLISGGSGLVFQTGESEAAILKRWLTAQGLPEGSILTEETSRNTGENAVQSSKIALARGWKKTILVTSAFHMHRSVLAFEKTGLEVLPFPVDFYLMDRFPGPEAVMPSESALSLSTTAIKEYIGIAAYWLRGYI